MVKKFAELVLAFRIPLLIMNRLNYRFFSLTF